MILITGANGQLGQEFQKLFYDLNLNYLATDKNELDITNILKVRNFIKNKNISLIINCAAYNDVDKAEDEKDICTKLNTYAPRDLSIIAKEINADFITYSSDFIFDGLKLSPYTEEDIPNPLSHYGKSKFLGEQEVLKANPESFIIRTSWVFGMGGNNFVKQVINWSKLNSHLKIVDDQISAPTYSKDLAYFSWLLIKTKKYGIYHMSNNGFTSKYEQALYILEKINWVGLLEPVKSSHFKLKALRPKMSKLNSSKVESLLKKSLPSWKESLDEFLSDFK